MPKLPPTPIRIEKNFSAVARELRAVFERKFADPRKTAGERFVWDYWHIENQYSVLRTPARHYFPKPLFERLERELVSYGQTRLGCNGISDPWISLYVDGSYQNFHADSPHGPWAYVFSLTKWKSRAFRGGETLVARDSLLDFWPAFTRDRRNERGIEFDDLFASIPPEWNRLTLFDPRLPHGVKEVRGTRDPLGGRLVIHGWFVEPRPFVNGALAANASLHRKTGERLDEVLAPLARELGRYPSLQGTLSIRAHVAPSGRVGRQDLLVHTLVNSAEPRDTKLPLEAIRHVAESLDSAEFPRARGKSTLTIPFLFRN
ncbi:MAG: 2OG-Fe(II) oxygenase [Bdellovibrionales bacterium]|nr:2OG-Fe(II) oxygenase [Bdellovibrionales bacterium]